MKFPKLIPAPQRKNPLDFNDPMTFLLNHPRHKPLAVRL